MNFLKLKSILLGLIAVFTVTALLTSCEQETLNNLEEEVSLQKAEQNFMESFEQNAEENVEERGFRKLFWSNSPNSIYLGNNFMSAVYSIDRPGFIIAQVFNCNWDQIGESRHFIKPGFNIKRFAPSGSGFGNKRCYGENNYIEIKLTDLNRKEIAPKLTRTAIGR